MFKILSLISFFIILWTNIACSKDEYKIVVKVNNNIISNYDVERERNYLSALNPNILNIPDDEIKKIATKSLIREIIKEKEISKYYNIDYQSPDLINLANTLYERLNINTEAEFQLYLEKYNLNLNNVLKKLAVESYWNRLVYDRYKDKIIIDKVKIKKNLELDSANNKTVKLFRLSEILFNAKNQKEFDDKFTKIVESIKNKNFGSAATIYSVSDTSKFNGEIGWVSKNDISEKIYQQISKLKVNEFTQPLKISTGFLLINLDEIKEEERKVNIEEQYNNIISKETNRQLNQYSTIYFKKIEKLSFIYEN